MQENEQFNTSLVGAGMDKRWIVKYHPKKPEDLIGHSRPIYQLKNWLEKYGDSAKKYRLAKSPIGEKRGKKKTRRPKGKKRPKGNTISSSSAIITGNHGIGKTCMAETILNSLGINIKRVNFGEIGSLKKPEDYARKMLKSYSIYDLLSTDDKTNDVILIDNLESIKSPTEKKFVTALVEENDRDWSYPIVFISDNEHNKFAMELKSYMYEIKMDDPGVNQFTELINKICVPLGMKFANQKVLSHLLDNSQSDYRKIISTLEDLYMKKGSKTITIKDLNERYSFHQKKDGDMNIFKLTNVLFTDKKVGINEALTLYETNRTVIPLMLQKYGIKHIDKYAKNPKDKLNIMNNVTESMAKGDLIENYMYEHQMWALQDIQGFYSCVNPNHNISSTSKENLKISVTTEYEYVVDFTRDSIKSINKKNIKKTRVVFPNMGVMDILRMKNILVKLLEQERYDEYKELLEGYNPTDISVLASIKVDKILGSKVEIPSSLMKKIKNNT
jgi:hypothetical protein